MLIIDLIASFFLKFSHNNIIIPLFFFAYIYLDKKLFFKAAIILLSSVLLNYILKNIFQVPLYPWLGQGYAFLAAICNLQRYYMDFYGSI